MKYNHYALFGALLSMGSAQAATTVSFTDIGNGGGSTTPSQGTLAYTTKVGDSTGSSGSIVYTVTGLTLDDVGVADDSIVITLTASTNVGNIEVNSSNGSNWIADDANTANFIDTGTAESVTIAYTSFGLTLGSGQIGDTADLSFDGFTQIEVGKGGGIVIGDKFTANGDTYTATVADVSLFNLTDTSESSLVLEADNFDTRLNRWSFDVTYNAVPEPSSTALIGLGGLALILRRRK